MSTVPHWGVTGWSTVWSSLEQDDDDGTAAIGSGVGFVRVLEPGVVYLRPPAVDEWSAWSESPGGRKRRYQMPWPEDQPPEAQTVLDMHARLAPRRASLEPEDDQLRQLDAAILESVREVDRLHRAGGTLGFVQPDSVMFCRLRDGRLRIVFPDVGFAWDESQGLREPKWIAEPQLDCLFEEGPRRHNAASLEAFREIPTAQQGKGRGKEKLSAALATAQANDVRLLGRLIAVALAGPDEVKRWCGVGRSFLAVPGRDRAPDTQAPVWDQVVTPTLLGKITSCAGLLERLEVAPPSEHYLFKPPAPPPIWKTVVRRTLPGLVGLAALVGLLAVLVPIVREIIKRPPPHVLCDTVFPGDPRYGQLDELEKARGEAQVAGLAAVAHYWSLVEQGDALPPACLGRLRKEAAELINTQALTIPDRLRDEPMPRGAQVDMLQEAFGLAKAAEQAAPGSCQRVVGLLLRQLEARGEVPKARTPARRAAADSPTPEAPPAASDSPAASQPPAAADSPSAEEPPAAADSPSNSEPPSTSEPPAAAAVTPPPAAQSAAPAPRSEAPLLSVTEPVAAPGPSLPPSLPRSDAMTPPVATPSAAPRTVSRGAAVVGVLAGLAGVAAAPEPAVSAESRVIYMVIQAEPTTTMGEVKEKFELARQATKGCNVREVLIEPIDPQAFTVLRSILQRGLGAVQDEQASAERIQPVVGMDSAWSIDLGDPFRFIERVAVTLHAGPERQGDAGEVVTVTGPGPNPEGYSLKLHSPGRYVLSLPKGTSPRSIRFDVVREDGKSDVEKETIEQEWPSVGRAYLVTLSDVVGDASLLFDSLKDPNKVSNPIREIQDATKASLMVASFVEVLGNRLRIQEGQITFSFPKPQGVNPKRLWILFPLTAGQLAKTKESLAALLAEPDGFKRLPETIRASVLQERLDPGTGAAWVELPLTGEGFVGNCELDLAAWKGQLASSPDAVGDNALLVYEFENEQGTKLPLKMLEGYVVPDRIAEWLPALRAAR